MFKAANDTKTGEVKTSGATFKVSCVFLQYPGEVVSRAEIRKRFWAADTFVDFDHGLNAAIKRLRDALGDAADNRVFIETPARRGYRSNAPVQVAPALLSPEATSTLPSP
jgi:DNA-binding winged helix-turn-helix (wHTH) protein